jgi:sec-independent protein translocase protein TatB
MFDIGWSELLVIVIVAIVVVGPKDLPKLMRTFGHYAGKFRRAASDFQRQFEAAMAESEMDAVRKNIESIKEGIDKSVPDTPILSEPVMLPKPDSTTPTAAAPPAEAKPPKAKPKRVAAKSAASAKPAAKRRKAQAKS